MLLFVLASNLGVSSTSATPSSDTFTKDSGNDNQYQTTDTPEDVTQSSTGSNDAAQSLTGNNGAVQSSNTNTQSGESSDNTNDGTSESETPTQAANGTFNASNLVISNFQVPDTAKIGTTYPVTVTVTNRGNVSSGSFPVYLWENNTLLGQQTVNSLAAGQSTDVVFNWIPTTSGTKDLQAGLNLSDLVTKITLYNGGNGSTKITYPSTANSIEYNGLWNLTGKTIISTVMWNATNIADEYDVEVYSGSKYAKWRYQQNRMVSGIWWDIGLSRNDAVYYNGFTDADLSNINKIKVSFNTPTSGTKTGYIKEIKIRDTINTQGYVTFRFDDGTQSQYDNVYSQMQSYGYKGSIFPVINWVGYSGAVTVDKLNTLYNSGWDVGSHTMNHYTPYNLTEAQMRSELGDSKQWLLNHGYNRSADLFAAPFFAMTPTYYNLIAEYYKMCGVGQADTADMNLGVPGGIASTVVPPSNFFQVTTSDLTLDNLPQYFPTALNATAKNGEWLVILIHTVSTNSEKSNFAALLQAVKASGCQVKTFSEMYELANRSPIKQVTVTGTTENKSDLVVSNLNVPSNPQTGTTYPVSFTVTNTGSVNAGSFLISLSDGSTVIGQQTISGLASGQNTTVTINWTPSTTGLRNINATADVNNAINEINEANNNIIQQVNVAGARPDLAVSNLQLPSNPQNGTSYPVSFTVTNNGSANAGSFMVSLSDGSITIGQQNITGLASGQNTTVTFNWIPSTTGLRSINATADVNNVINETNEANNKITQQVSVTSSQGLPDLVITNYQTPTTAKTGTVSPITITVTNNGSKDAGSFVIYLGENNRLVAEQTVSGLAAGQSTDVVFNWIPSSGGTIDSQARVDATYAINESDETNNYGPVKQVSVTVDQGLPDLVITNFQTPTTAKAGTVSTINVTVTNAGSKDAGSFVIYLGENNRLVGEQTVSGLAAGQSTNIVFNWIPSTVGTIDSQSRVDATYAVIEYDETNNYGPLRQITVT